MFDLSIYRSDGIAPILQEAPAIGAFTRIASMRRTEGVPTAGLKESAAQLGTE